MRIGILLIAVFATLASALPAPSDNVAADIANTHIGDTDVAEESVASLAGKPKVKSGWWIAPGGLGGCSWDWEEEDNKKCAHDCDEQRREQCEDDMGVKYRVEAGPCILIPSNWFYPWLRRCVCTCEDSASSASIDDVSADIANTDIANTEVAEKSVASLAGKANEKNRPRGAEGGCKVDWDTSYQCARACDKEGREECTGEHMVGKYRVDFMPCGFIPPFIFRQCKPSEMGLRRSHASQTPGV
ncbi:hypothetical protein CKAH01_10240 [Colletotrichum kahawae]|uniref:Uncharacterized protein n=1 Tax=Colletotrichum kahawae TaxID=34407 RepID=A0AAD9XWE2_COLKA|nr:hypothetical protein CKAH01_10240 [Colletotrichum kahawae]